MSKARLVVTAVRLEGRPVSQVARDYSVSRRWVHELLRRYDTHGEPGLQPRSRRPRHSPHATSPAIQDEVVALRKTLTDQGLDAGATPSPTISPNGTGTPRPPRPSGAS